MYAIVDIAGQQFRVEQNKVLKVPYLRNKIGDTIEFDHVLLLADDKKVKIGQPRVKGAKVSAKVLQHDRDDKVLVLKKKRRKGYKKVRGHRQNFTKIQIDKIS
jgi:large subunit ribosomal protein L21